MTDITQIDREYRRIGGTTWQVWEHELTTPSLNGGTSPLYPHGYEMWKTAGDASALFLAQATFENDLSRTGILIQPEDWNPVAMRPWVGDPLADHDGEVIHWKTRQRVGTIRDRAGNVVVRDGFLKVRPGAVGAIADDRGGLMLRFENPVWAVKEWRRRLFDDPGYKGTPGKANGPYTTVHTLADMLETYCPSSDVHPVTGLPNAEAKYLETVVALLTRYAAMEGGATGGDDGVTQGDETMPALTFGRVPHPGYVDLQATTADKPEGFGWDNLGKREVKHVALHGMWGTLRGTDQVFGDPRVPSLTDYGIGTANVDGAALDGVIHKYNDPRGYRSGWASGPVSAPYGDGLAFVNRYGINGVNRYCVSIETSGKGDPFTAFAWGELVKLVAYWADQAKIPHNVLPLNPHDNINFVIWHEEFTYGTGKRCPFDWMKANTDRLYADVAAYLKPFQEGAGVPQPKPPVVVVPTPKYPDPLPVPELAALADADADKAPAITTDEFNHYTFVNDRVRAIRDTPRMQYAPNGPRIGPDIKKGETFDVRWLVTAADGTDYYITGYWTRVRAKDTERVSDSTTPNKVA